MAITESMLHSPTHAGNITTCEHEIAVGPRTQALNKLFARWSTQTTDPGKFNPDGILNEQVWEKARPRIALLMKETYDLTGDLRKHLLWQIGEEKRPRHCSIWPKVAGRWIAGILHQEAHKEQAAPIKTFGDVALIRNEDWQHENWRLGLASSAVINLKKLTGRSSAQNAELLAAARRDLAFLKEELEIIQPDVVLCCHTFHIARQASLIPEAPPLSAKCESQFV